jgi:hypothetical protein
LLEMAGARNGRKFGTQGRKRRSSGQQPGS